MIFVLFMIIVWPFKMLFRFLRWSFTNGLKGYITLGVVLLVCLISFFVVSSNIRNNEPAEVVQIGIPSIQQAPYIVQTPSRYYYAQTVEKDEGVTTLINYWELSGDTWMQGNTLVLDESFGTVTVGKRR